jgi:hypothetical protein
VALPKAALAVAIWLAGAGVLAQPAGARPPRAGAAPRNDEEYARLVRQWTTRPEFMSPLVDHLPRSTTVPSPRDILGYYIGEPQRLTYVRDQQRYFRALEQASLRVKTMTIGRTEEGREILVAFVSSEGNIRDLESNRQRLRRLADPRGLSPVEARELIARTKPHYHITAGLHSTEVSPPEMVIELAYRLAVSDEAYIAKIRENVIVSFTPALEVDGRDRVVDWYYAHKTSEPADNSESFGGPPYWGKYVFHDDNRDINYGVDSLRHHLNWYLRWVPPIWHDLHQAQPFLYTFSGQPPNNENLDPILYSELPWFATYEVGRLTAFGMPGVWHFGFVDTWSPGYLGFAASNHNGLLRMYEIYNTDGANTKKVRIGAPAGSSPAPPAASTSREWFRPWPAYREVEWSIRNAINYSETALLSALELTSTFPSMIVENFYNKSRNALERGRKTPPHAYVLPAGQPDMTRVVRVVNLLRMQGIEVGRARAAVTTNDGSFPAGSFLVKLNQPYGPLAKTLLERQRFPEGNLRTYDDSGWTMGLMSHIDVREVTDSTILDAPADLLDADAPLAGSITGDPNAPTYVVAHNGSLNLITLRYRLKDLAVRATTARLTLDGVEYPSGSFIVPNQRRDTSRIRGSIEALGLTATAVSAAPDVETVDLDLPRIAVYSTWASTEKVGWVRLAFDRFEVPYDLIYKDQVRHGGLRAKWDVIVVPPQGSNAKALVYEQPTASKPLPYKKSDRFPSLGAYGETDDVRGGMGLQGAIEFQKFVEEGGLLITLGTASFFPPDFGLTRTVDARPTQGTFYAPGPIVRAEILQPSHPVFFGYNDRSLSVRWADGPLLQTPEADDPTPQSGGPSRPTVLMRFRGGEPLSGLMRGHEQIRQRPAMVEAIVGKGRVLLYVTNPIYRWQNFGEHNLVFNALLFYNDMDGRVARR